MDFGGPDPRKSSSRLSETLILLKSPFLAQGRFLIENGAQNGAKMELKSHQTLMISGPRSHFFASKNPCQKIPGFFIDFRRPWEPSGSILEAFWTKFGGPKPRSRPEFAKNSPRNRQELAKNLPSTRRSKKAEKNK